MGKIILKITSMAMMILFLATSPSLGKVGVGINLGKIEVNEPLYAGGSYKLAKMGVANTGDEQGQYEVGISYLEGQTELKPEKSWFRFKPEKFFLKPGQAKEVEISLALPVSAKPGKYFAFIEGRPTPKKKGLAVGVAAASKLTFTIKSASLFWSILNWINSILADYSPYSYIFIALIILLIIWLFLRRYLTLSFSLKKREKS